MAFLTPNSNQSISTCICSVYLSDTESKFCKQILPGYQIAKISDLYVLKIDFLNSQKLENLTVK
jgi:hypothetical protein